MQKNAEAPQFARNDHYIHDVMRKYHLKGQKKKAMPELPVPFWL